MAIFSWLGGDRNTAGQGTSPEYPLPPAGRQRAFPLLGQTLSFHDAAHDEVTSLVKETGSSTVCLNVINRNVALVTSYHDAIQVLDQSWDKTPPVSRAKAYDQLMSTFYSPPNLLLEDEEQQGAKEHRKYWDENVEQALKNGQVQEKVMSIIAAWLSRTTKTSRVVDLYDSLKDLGHDLALGTFISKDSSSTDKESHEQLKTWSEEMLRGQFTLPIGLNLGFFQNTFSRGQAAKVQFDQVVRDQLQEEDATQQCPFAVNVRGKLSSSSLSSHHAMFSSSLVVKSFASLATALLLQLFKVNENSKTTLASELLSIEDDLYNSRLEGVITETERISPPIVGVMRRVTSRNGIKLEASKTNVPCGWDIWPYFPLANRDKTTFGDDASLFKAHRYWQTPNTPRPLTFGAGVKSCVGRNIVRMWLRELAVCFLGRGNTLIGYDMEFEQVQMDDGVQSWLGWLAEEKDSTWKGGVKQLPTQRPRNAISVEIRPKGLAFM